MKKSKKFVLAALVLLAITGLLALAGCKNDSVPETPAAKLVSISVNPPTRTVYSVGQSFDPTGMKVTATYEGGKKQEVTGWTTNFGTVAAKKGLGKEVTVSYKDGETTKTTTFTVTVFPEEVKVLTNYTNSHAPEGEWTYVAFGEWPQTILKGDVEVDESEGKEMGMFTYYLGDDGNHYVKAEENACEAGYKYSDDSEVKQKDESSSPSTRWFKVEPIVWRVLTTSYEAPEGGTVGEILLLAEKILTGGIPYYDVWDTDRTVDEATIHPNNYEHSAVRAWLNGLEYLYKGPDDAEQVEKNDYFGKGFLQTAFTESAQDLIADTTVDNRVTSTFGTWEKTEENPYACDKTNDKIFLLSQQEATTSGYGFAASSNGDSTRIRVTTDYAEATGAYQRNPSEGYGGWWWLRSPNYDYEYNARVINNHGYALSYDSVYSSYGGVVPALSISLGGN